VSGTKINRKEYELYLRNMTSEIIDNNEVVKSIVDDVFEQININSLHKRYRNRDEAKVELVSFTRKCILEYLDTYSEVDKYNDVKEDLNSYAKKYFKYNMYFKKNKSIQFTYSEEVIDLIDAEFDKLSNMEKEILIRRFYFFQSSEKIANALNISTYKVYSMIRQLVRSIWSKVLLNDDIVRDEKPNIAELTKGIEEYFTAISGKNKSFAKYKVVDKEIEEYFIIRLLDNSKINEIEFTFDDICLENMSRIKPEEEDYENLEYLSVYRHYSQDSVNSKFKKKKAFYRNIATIAVGGVMCLSMVLFFGKNSVFAKASNNIDTTYKVSSTKMGLIFTYNKEQDDIDIDIVQNYYVDDNSLPDYTEKIDTQLAIQVDKNNLYADLRNVEQTVYESASKYLSSKNEGEFKYHQGDRKYVYNELYNILFVAEYADGAWECTKVIYVDKIKPTSKYHLDDHNTLQDFYKDSNDGKWKCDLYNDKKDNTFTEITFEDDDSKMSGLGTYKTSNMHFKRVFNKNTGRVNMTQTYEAPDKVQEDRFITYIIEEGNTYIYYNYYKNGQAVTEDVCVVNNNILENVVDGLASNPGEILRNIKSYGIKLPGTEEYILPYLEYQVGNNLYSSDYYEFTHYDMKEMEKNTNLALKVYSNKFSQISVYRLYNKDYYKEVKNIEEYKKAMDVKNHIFYDLDTGDYKIRVFDNSFVEILEYKGNDIKVKIPAYLNGYQVWYIGNDVFKCNDIIKEIVIPKTIKEIGANAFKECENLKKVTFKGNIISIGKEAFEECESLSVFDLKNTPNYIGEDCFEDTKLIEEMDENNGVLYLRRAAIKLVDKKKTLKLKDKTITVADGFAKDMGGKLESIKLPDSVEYLGKYAFANAAELTNIEFNSKVHYIGKGALKGCARLKEVKISSGIKIINEDTFKDCINLEMVELPTSVKAIRKGAFEGSNNKCKMRVSNNTKCIF